MSSILSILASNLVMFCQKQTCGLLTRKGSVKVTGCVFLFLNTTTRSQVWQCKIPNSVTVVRLKLLLFVLSINPLMCPNTSVY